MADGRLDYYGLKHLAAEMGLRSWKSLLAMSPGCDPYAADLPARRRNAEWFAEIFDRLGVANDDLRRLHYRLVSQRTPVLKPNGEVYINTDEDSRLLSDASLSARYCGLLKKPLTERHNPGVKAFARNLWGDIEPPLVHSLSAKFDRWYFNLTTRPPYFGDVKIASAQDWIYEIWIEKGTLNDVLVPLADDVGFNLVVGKGEISEVQCRLAVERARAYRRPMHIGYLSDFDPGGRSMPNAIGRKLQFWCERAPDVQITLDPIALTFEQCIEHSLPRTPLKASEQRAAKFEKRFGPGATEIDALEALYRGELAKIIRADAARYLDPTLEDRTRDAQREIDRMLREAEARVRGPHQEKLDDIRNRQEALQEKFREMIEAELEPVNDEAAELNARIEKELEAAMPSITKDNIPKARPARPKDEPLFDSRRSYLDQLDHFHRWQGRD